MKMKIAYEVMDLRVKKAGPLGPVAVVVYVPGGINIETNNGHGVFVDAAADVNDDMLDDSVEGVVAIDFPEGGSIILTRLRLANYRERVYPYINGNPGPFESDDAVNEHFYRYITERM